MIVPFLVWGPREEKDVSRFRAHCAPVVNGRLRRLQFRTSEEAMLGARLNVESLYAGTRVLLQRESITQPPLPLEALTRVRFDEYFVVGQQLHMMVALDECEPLNEVWMLATFDTAPTAEQRAEERKKQRERQRQAWDRPRCSHCGQVR